MTHPDFQIVNVLYNMSFDVVNALLEFLVSKNSRGSGELHILASGNLYSKKYK